MSRLLWASLVIALVAGVAIRLQASDPPSVSGPDSPTTMKAKANANAPTVAASPGGSDVASGRKGPFLMQAADSIVGNGLDLIERNRAAALGGDGEAAYAIFRVLTECEQQALGQAGMEAGIECEGITPEQMAESLAFLKTAAEAGVLQAQLSYSNFASDRFETVADVAKNIKEFEQFKQDSMRYLSSAARSGSVEGLLAMSEAYRQGMLTEQNPVQAYAYLHAVNQSGLTSPADTGLALLGASLNPVQLQQATLLGNNLYRQCCN